MSKDIKKLENLYDSIYNDYVYKELSESYKILICKALRDTIVYLKEGDFKRRPSHNHLQSLIYLLRLLIKGKVFLGGDNGKVNTYKTIDAVIRAIRYYTESYYG